MTVMVHLLGNQGKFCMPMRLAVPAARIRELVGVADLVHKSRTRTPPGTPSLLSSLRQVASWARVASTWRGAGRWMFGGGRDALRPPTVAVPLSWLRAD